MDRGTSLCPLSSDPDPQSITGHCGAGIRTQACRLCSRAADGHSWCPEGAGVLRRPQGRRGGCLRGVGPDLQLPSQSTGAQRKECVPLDSLGTCWQDASYGLKSRASSPTCMLGPLSFSLLPLRPSHGAPSSRTWHRPLFSPWGHYSSLLPPNGSQSG